MTKSISVHILFDFTMSGQLFPMNRFQEDLVDFIPCTTPIFGVELVTHNSKLFLKKFCITRVDLSLHLCQNVEVDKSRTNLSLKSFATHFGGKMLFLVRGWNNSLDGIPNDLEEKDSFIS